MFARLFSTAQKRLDALVSSITISEEAQESREKLRKEILVIEEKYLEQLKKIVELYSAVTAAYDSYTAHVEAENEAIRIDLVKKIKPANYFQLVKNEESNEKIQFDPMPDLPVDYDDASDAVKKSMLEFTIKSLAEYAKKYEAIHLQYIEKINHQNEKDNLNNFSSLKL